MSVNLIAQPSHKKLARLIRAAPSVTYFSSYLYSNFSYLY